MATNGSEKAFEAEKAEAIWITALAVTAVFLCVFGARVWMISRYASDLPYWDQWDAEAAFLYKPYFEGTLHFGDLFSSHNEHRILLGRLLAIALLELAGYWDPKLEMIVNAGLYASFCAGLYAAIVRLAPSNDQRPIFVLFLVFCLPFGWENLLSGFQSQFFLLLILSFIALFAGAGAKPFSMTWFVAMGASTLAYFSMASGALVPFALVVLHLLQMFAGVRRASLREWASIVGLICLGTIMTYFVTDVEAHDVLKAHDAATFLYALVRLGSFPLPLVGLPLMLAPPLLFLYAVLRRKPSVGALEWTMLGLCAWLAAQIISLALGRSSSSLSSRYLDLVLWTVPVYFVMLRYSVDSIWPGSAAPWKALPQVWGIVLLTVSSIAGISTYWDATVERNRLTLLQEANVAGYLADGDIEHLADKPFLTIPYPDAARLAMLLSDPTIRSILPPSFRPPDASDPALKLHLGGRLGRFVTAAKLRALSVAGIVALVALFVGLLGLTQHRRNLPSSVLARRS